MAQPHLRIYAGSEAAPNELENDSPQVRVALGDVLPALLEAARTGRGWLHDFADEEVAISPDLYEVIMAYQYYCRPSA